MSITLTPPAGYSASQLVFEDNFSGSSLNTNSWNTFMTSNAAGGWAWDSSGVGGSGLGATYDAEYDMPSQVSVNNGLTLAAVRKSITANGTTYPYTSGVISSYGKLEFNGGFLQISMKAPSGNGSWPALWLLPGSGAGSSGDNFEIDMQEGGMTGGGAAVNNTMAYNLHTPDGNQYGGDVNTGVNLSSGFNTYAINWVPGKSITWYLNGTVIGQVTSAQCAIPNEPMELIISNEVANSSASAWHTAVDSTTPSTMAMQIADVQLYQTPGLGESVVGGNVTPVAAAAPTVAITSPGATVTATNQTISGTVDVADAGSTVKILDGKTQIGSAVVAANGTWSANVTLTSLGANVLTATDANGNGTGVSNAVTYNVVAAAAAPTVAITSPGATVTSANQTISGTVDVADAGSTVKILDGTTQVGSAVVAANGAWSANVTLTSLGANVLTATDTNATGSGVSNAVTYNMVAAATATPTVAITSNSRWTALANQTIQGTVDVADAGSTVKILDGKTQIGSAVVAANGAWSANVTLTSLGANVLTATDTNASGKGVSNAVTLNLSSGVPKLAITSSGGTTALASQTITGTANLANTYVGSTVNILDGKTQIGTATVAANGNWSANVTLVNQGANVLTATDANGNGTGVSKSVTFNLAAAVTTAAVAAPLSAVSASSSSLVTNSVASSAVVADTSSVSSTTTAKVALLNQYAASGFATDSSSAPSIAAVVAHNASQNAFLAFPRH